MSALRVLARTARRQTRAASLLPSSTRRYASSYTSDISGLTDDQLEVRTLVHY